MRSLKLASVLCAGLVLGPSACGAGASSAQPTTPAPSPPSAPSTPPREQPAAAAAPNTPPSDSAVARFGHFTARIPAGYHLSGTTGPETALAHDGDRGRIALVDYGAPADVTDDVDGCVVEAAGVAEGFLHSLTGRKVAIKPVQASGDPHEGCTVLGTFGTTGFIGVAFRRVGDRIANVVCLPDTTSDGPAQARACGEVVNSIAAP